MEDDPKNPAPTKPDPDAPKAPEPEPEFQPRKGGRVLFCYLSNGPIYRQVAAKITKVGKAGAGESGVRLDLLVTMPTPPGEPERAPVPELDVRASSAPDQGRTWAPPPPAKPKTEPAA